MLASGISFRVCLQVSTGERDDINLRERGQELPAELVDGLLANFVLIFGCLRARGYSRAGPVS
jgi:hypothetical protein